MNKERIVKIMCKRGGLLNYFIVELFCARCTNSAFDESIPLLVVLHVGEVHFEGLQVLLFAASFVASN